MKSEDCHFLAVSCLQSPSIALLCRTALLYLSQQAIRFRSSIPFTSDTGQCTNSRALPGNGTAQKTAEIFNRPMILNRNRALKNDASKQKLKVTSIWQMLQQFYFYDIYCILYNCHNQFQYIAILLEIWSHPAAPDKHHHSIRLNSFGQFGATSWKWLPCCMTLYRSMGTFDYLLTPEEWHFNGTAEWPPSFKIGLTQYNSYTGEFWNACPVVIHSLGTLQDSGIGGQSVLFPAESLEIFMLRVLTSIRLQFETATSRMLKASNDDPLRQVPYLGYSTSPSDPADPAVWRTIYDI